MCKSGEVQVEVKENPTGKIMGQMTFDPEGMAKTLEQKPYIIAYIDRIVTYTRKDVSISINGTSLEQFPLMLTHDAGNQVDHQGS